MASKVVTIGQILDAIEQNGLPQAFNKFFVGKRGKFVSQRAPTSVGAACAVGQGAYNLGVNVNSLEMALAIYPVDEFKNHRYIEIIPPGRENAEKFFSVVAAIEQLNDKYRVPVPEIARLVRSYLTPEILGQQVAVEEHNYA